MHRSSSSSSPTSQVNDENNGWKLLLSSLLNIDSDHLEARVEVNDTEVILSTSKRELVEQLTEKLRSPEAVIANLNYTLYPEQEDSSYPQIDIYEGNYPTPMSLQAGTGRKIFERLFGHDTLTRIGVIAWEEQNSEGAYLLYARCGAGLTELTQAQIGQYKSILRTASYEALRKSIAHDMQSYKALDGNFDTQSLADAGVLSEHLDKMLYFSSDKQHIYFDFGLLIRCITAPQVVEKQDIGAEEKQKQCIAFYSDNQHLQSDLSILFQEEHDAQSWTSFSIDKKHLLSYLSIIFREGFIFYVDGDRARPICLNVERAVPMSNLVSLILDCSQSMQDSFDSYIDHVIDFLYKLYNDEKFDRADIRITTFNDETGPTKVFSLNDIDSMEAYLRSLYANGHTRLNDTVYKEMTNIVNSTLDLDRNTTVVIFTDGVDNSSEAHSLKNISELQNRLQSNGNPPKIYTMGLGAEYDATLLNALAQHTGGEHIHLKHINDFDKIVGHAATMSRARRLAHFLQEMKEKVTQFLVRAYEGTIVVADHTLQLPGDFTVDGKSFHAEKGGATLIPKRIEQFVQALPAGTVKAATKLGIMAVDETREIQMIDLGKRRGRSHSQ